MFEGLAQPMHLLVLLFIAILFFGPSKLGDFGKGLGDGIRHFKDALKEGESKPGPSASVTPKDQ
jgi:sec-independent protein translocase protein TatA